MNLSKANGGSLVRAVIDAVHLTADENDVSGDDWSEAAALLDEVGNRHAANEREAFTRIVSALRLLRAARAA